MCREWTQESGTHVGQKKAIVTTLSFIVWMVDVVGWCSMEDTLGGSIWLLGRCHAHTGASSRAIRLERHIGIESDGGPSSSAPHRDTTHEPGFEHVRRHEMNSSRSYHQSENQPQH